MWLALGWHADNKLLCCYTGWLRSGACMARLPMFTDKSASPKAFYLPDIFIFLPEHLWDKDTLRCPKGCRVQIGTYQYQTKHAARRCAFDLSGRAHSPHHPRDDCQNRRPTQYCFSCRILHFKAPYFVMAKRYHCTECHSRFDRCRVDQAALLGVSLTTIKRSDVDEASFSFMPWDARVLPLMKAGRGAHFPAHLTARGGVDKTVLDLMRIVFNSGVRPGTFAAAMLELNSKEHTLRRIAYEHELRELLASLTPPSPIMFSAFKDPLGYAGCVPKGVRSSAPPSPPPTRSQH